MGGGLRGGLEPWRWLPDVTGLSGNRLLAQLPEAAAVSAAARLGLWPLHSVPSAAATAAARRGSLPTASSQPQVRDSVRLQARGDRRQGGQARVGRADAAACAAPLAAAPAPGPARPGQRAASLLRSATVCSCLWRAARALLLAAGLPGAGPGEDSPDPRSGKAREKVGPLNFAGGKPPPPISSPSRKKQDTVKWGRGAWRWGGGGVCGDAF